MSCYLSIELDEQARECGGCSQDAQKGVVAWTDEIQPGKLVPLCDLCLEGLDLNLATFARLSQNAYAIICEQRRS